MDAGKLVPDDLVVGIVKERLLQPDAARASSSTAFPRTIPQAEKLDEALRRSRQGARRGHLARGADRDARRAHLRPAELPEDGSVYHVVQNPPRRDGLLRPVRRRAGPARGRQARERPHPAAGLRGRRRPRSRLLRPEAGCSHVVDGVGAPEGIEAAVVQAVAPALELSRRMAVEIKSAPRDRAHAARRPHRRRDPRRARGGRGARGHHLGARSARRAPHRGEGGQAGLQGLPRLPGRALRLASTTRWCTASPAGAGSSPRAT